MSPTESSKLRCRYVHKNNPFLMIAPLKEEEVYLKPNIFIYHEAIYTEEIEAIKKIATPRVSTDSTVRFYNYSISFLNARKLFTLRNNSLSVKSPVFFMYLMDYSL